MASVIKPPIRAYPHKITGSVDELWQAIRETLDKVYTLQETKASAVSSLEDTFQNIILYPAVNYPLGSFFFATDTGVLYINRLVSAANTWVSTIPTPAVLPRSLAYNSVAQVIANITPTKLTFDTNMEDVGGIHSTSVNPTRFTVPAGQGGEWLFVAMVNFAAAAAGNIRQIIGLLNGVGMSGVSLQTVPPSGAGNVVFVHISSRLTLNAGDFMEAQVFQDSGGNLNANGGAIIGSFVSLNRLS